MAVVNNKSTVFGITGVAGYAAPAGASRDGKLHRVTGSVANLISDNTGSKYLLCEIPWSAIIHPTTAFRTDGWGFAQAVIGTDEATTGLLNAAKGVSAAGQNPITIFDAKWGKPLWQQLGLPAMPTSGPAKLYARGIADATVAGTLSFDISYSNHLG